MQTDPLDGKLLNFSTMSAEEFDGKVIIIDGCPYKLGSRIGSGTEKFVHQLVNLQTSLSHFVLKIHRGAEADKSLAMMLFIMDVKDEVCSTIGKGSSPDMMPVSWGNTNMHIQHNFNPREPDGPAYESLLEADRLYKNKDYDGAVDALNTTLGVNPNHSDAYGLAAIVMSAAGDFEMALEHIDRAISLEPNFRPYLSLAIDYSMRAYEFRYASDMCMRLVTKYPYDHDQDESAVLSFIAMGSPEMAATFRYRRNLASVEHDSLIEADIHAKNSAMPFWIAAREGGRDRSERISNLAKAHEQYPSGALVRANFGLMNIHFGDLEKGLRILQGSVSCLPNEELAATAIANCAFGYFKKGEFVEGSDLLVKALRLMARRSDGPALFLSPC